MASGTPVVASNRGAIPEVVQHPGALFDPEDVEGMAKRICQIAESADLRDELVQGGKLAVQKFTWEAHGADVDEAYRAVSSRWV
jgi:glycosyltransferase involved in cell wall biosynthesis